MVIAGKDKGKSGKIMRIDHKNDQVTVEKVNMRIKHIKKSQGRPGEKISFEAPLAASNVMVIDPKTGKPTRIRYNILADGNKDRIAIKSSTSLIGAAEEAPTKAKKKVKA